MSFFINLIFDNIVTIVIFIISLHLLRTYQKRLKLPPGPWPWPLVGNLFLMIKGDKRQIFRDLRRKYGDLVGLKFGGRHVLLVSGLDMLNEVLVIHAKEFDKRPQVFTTLKIGQGKGVLNNSNKAWKEHRSFMVVNMKGLGIGKTSFQDCVLNEIKAFIAAIDSTSGRDWDPRYYVTTAVCNIISSISFGTRFDYEDPKFQEMENIFEENMRLAGGTSIVNYFPFLEKMPKDPFKCEMCLDNVAKIQKILNSWIEHHKKTLDPENPRDFIDLYLLEMKEKVDKKMKTTMDDSQLLKLVGDLFIAGTETTATTLRWALIFLVRNKESQFKLYQEISATLGTRTQLSFLDKQHMAYTNAFIMETQRLGDIGPFALPHSNFQPVQLGDYIIPAGTVVIPNLNSVSMDPDIWDEPSEFRPSRFLDENGKVMVGKAYIPFGLGPRMCPGRSLAEMELYFFITSIVQHFEILPAETEPLPTLDGHVGVTHVPNDFKVKLVRRNGHN